ncbi:hypothetical protein I4U23_006616 [Adineta vaga]|nr:hypothetical protein I4U23_006616 [Adineta vaga]
MSEEIVSNGKSTNEDKSSVTGKLDSMSKDDLIKLVKNQILFRKKLENKLNELTTASTSFNRTEEQLRNQLDYEQVKYSKLTDEFEQNKLHQIKLQEELDNLRNELSIVRLSLSDESQKSSSRSELLVNFISMTNDLFQLPISLPDLIDNEFLHIFKTELEQKQEFYRQTCEQIVQDKARLQERVEDLEFFNEEIKLENDDLRLKISKCHQEKQSKEKEIDNYRRQIEDFEEQFLELQRESLIIQNDQEQQQQLSLSQSNENIDEIILQCMNYILHQVDDNQFQSQISKASSTSSLLLLSDIPTLLHSVGITNGIDEDFSVPLNFESVLRLCTLLIERCRVLQYILLKQNDISMNLLVDQSIVFAQNNQNEQCRIFLHKQDHFVLDALFERIYTGMNQTMKSNDWQIVIEKSNDQKTSPYLRLEFDHFKFISNEMEHDFHQQRIQIEQLTKQIEEQRNEILLLEKRLLTNNTFTQLKEHQEQLEEQLAKQCEQTIQLENLLRQENLDKTRLDQLKHIELSYNELQTKLHIAEKLEEQLKDLNEKFHEKEVQSKRQHDLFDKLRADYERQHLYLVERDEKIRLLRLEIDEHEQFKENLIEKFQKEFEQQKQILLNATQNHEQRSSSVSKQQREEFEHRIEIKTKENENLLQRIHQLEIQMNESQILNDQIKLDKKKFTNEIQFLTDKITNLDKENQEYIQNINDLKQQIQSNKHHFDQTIENNNQTIEQGAIQLRQTIENTTSNFEISNQSELNNIREENERLHQIINELNQKYEKQISDPGENIQEFKEKYQKMKILLTRLKKELQDKNHQPKQSVMDLELADYDKTIKTLKDELIDKDKEIQDLREELSTSTDKYACLKLEIQSLEQQKNQIDHRANKLKALLDIAKKELQHAKDIELERYQTDDHGQERIDQLQNDFNHQKILINQLINEKHQFIEKLNQQNENNQKTVNLLEQNLRIVKHELDITKKDYDTLQDDFNNYKIRAQSVLKQQQTNQRERTPSLADKQIELEDTIEKFKVNLREANEKIESLTLENTAIQKEQARLIEVQTKLINESKKREQDLRKQHQLEIEKLEKDSSQQINDKKDTIKLLTLQNETLSLAYKEQITSMESDHKQSNLTLQNQIELLQQEIKDYKLHIHSLEEIINENENKSPIGISYHTNRDSIPAWNDFDHQQVEKIESINNESREMFDSIQSNSISNESHRLEEEEEVNQLKSTLSDKNELLHESELNNKHLIEQIAFLKDEIRRLERNMERNESISNLEYLKNIILKFFILKSIPERLQLIPVLVTMLKLSPDEQNQLERVANMSLTILDENMNVNESSTQQMTNGGVTSPSWSSYLNIW